MRNLKKFEKIDFKRIGAGILAFVMLFLVCSENIGMAYAAENTNVRYIDDFRDLLGFAAESQMLDFEGETVVLRNDIEITPIEQSILDQYKIKHLTVGKKDLPFKGVFDGQGHTIRGLKYDKKILPDANSGLFCCTKNAIIKNLIVENADIDCVYQGGIVVGYAENTTLENVTVLNCDLRIDVGNNIVSLITNGGFTGGGVVGILKDSKMYNCESSGSKVHNHVTAGITGVGGEGLYMGGLIGWASNSTIEYCRARSNYEGEGATRTVRQTIVKNIYDVAVGALGGKALYAGGIAGGVNNTTNFVDCFSTADVYFYAGNYVSVGSGIIGYGGGITGALRGNSNIKRCHYAGNISSKQYNAVLVIPIIQTDVNICGLTMKNEKGNVIEDSYFKPSAIQSGKSIPAVGGMDDNPKYGAKDDVIYQNRSFWEEHGYDFSGNTKRISSGKDGVHYNKWVMDYDLGIPVHGKSVSATFDFPDAGSVTIDKTTLVDEAVTTDNPLAFAVQGVRPNTHPDEKKECKFTATLNKGYNFKAWHKVENHYDKTAKSIEELQGITKATNNKVDNNQITTLNVKDNDLYVAEISADVVYHEIDGKQIRKDEYVYNDPLKDCAPNSIPSESKFYGWTTISNNGKGYEGITSSQLDNIKRAGELYKTGDRVTKPIDLYPIFVNSVANVNVIFEGHEQDKVNDPKKRTDVGHVEVGSDEKGVYVEAIGSNSDKSFHEGYTFKGWYKSMDAGNDYTTDSQKKTAEVCVSRDTKYYIPDLTEKVTYIARFEYKVEYWTKAYKQDNGNFQGESNLYTTVMHDYKETFQNIKGPGYGVELITGWGKEHVLHDKQEDCINNYSGTLITNPLKVYSHNYTYTDGNLNNYGVMADTDFPNAGKTYVDWVKGIGTHFEVGINTNERYFFNFWTFENDSNGAWTYKNSKFDTGDLSLSRNYKARAMAYTKLNFHKGDDSKNDLVVKECNRRYGDKILLPEDLTYMYQYHFSKNKGTEVAIDTFDKGKINNKFVSQASPSENVMNKAGYAFLGWISDAEVKKDSYEWNYIYDYNPENEKYCTSDVDKVKPYLVTDAAQVYETQDLYPVYAKYDIEVTNNVLEMGDKLPAGFNKPAKPTLKIVEDSKIKGKAKITITGETDKTPVLNTNTEGSKYKYESMSYFENTVEMPYKGKITVAGNTIIYEEEIMAGKHLKYVVNYNPLMVNYHCSKNNIVTEIRNKGEARNSEIEPDYDKITGLSNHIFLGWSENKPDINGEYILAESKQSAEKILSPKSEPVEHNMNLWPVFMTANINVNSNIDKEMTNETEFRGIRPIGKEKLQLWAKDDLPNLSNYGFVGWYKGYKNEDNPGTKISPDKNYLLQGNAVYENTTYTAVFKKSLSVVYHDTKGDPLYTVKVAENTRSFVERVNTEDGKEIESFIDMAANEALFKTFPNDNSYKFMEWQLLDDKNGKMILWKDFYNKNITESMNLYPKYAVIKAYDANNIDYTNKMEMGFVAEHKETPEIKTMVGVFREQYDQDKLKYVIQEGSFDAKENKMATTPVNEIPTRVCYIKKDVETNEDCYIEASIGPIKTGHDGEGTAIHQLLGDKVQLKIRKIWEGDKPEQRPEKIVLHISRSYENEYGNTIEDKTFNQNNHRVELCKTQYADKDVWEKTLDEKFDAYSVRKGKQSYYTYYVKEEQVGDYKTIVRYPNISTNKFHHNIDIYNVKNFPIVLPDTGGPGVKLLYVLGVILIISLMMFSFISKKKRK